MPKQKIDTMGLNPNQDTEDTKADMKQQFSKLTQA